MNIQDWLKLKQNQNQTWRDKTKLNQTKHTQIKIYQTKQKWSTPNQIKLDQAKPNYATPAARPALPGLLPSLSTNSPVSLKPAAPQHRSLDRGRPHNQALVHTTIIFMCHLHMRC